MDLPIIGKSECANNWDIHLTELGCTVQKGLKKPGMAAHACCRSTAGASAGGLQWIWCQPGLHTEFQESWVA